MKRDLDLVRAILIEIEKTPVGCAIDGPLYIEGYDSLTVTEHVRIMIEEGLVVGSVEDSMSDDEPTTLIDRLSWNGHEYLANIRSESVWNSVKETAKEKGVSLTFDIAKALASMKIRALLGLPPT